MRGTMASTFRTMARLEEQLVRQMMPKTSAADPARPTALDAPRLKATKTLTFKIGEVAHV